MAPSVTPAITETTSRPGAVTAIAGQSCGRTDSRMRSERSASAWLSCVQHASGSRSGGVERQESVRVSGGSSPVPTAARAMAPPIQPLPPMTPRRRPVFVVSMSFLPWRQTRPSRDQPIR